jgi:hypothetical protein
MKEDPMWRAIGPAKTALIRGFGFDIVGVHFVKRGNKEREPLTLTFEHARDTPIETLRAELSARAE